MSGTSIPAQHALIPCGPATARTTHLTAARCAAWGAGVIVNGVDEQPLTSWEGNVDLQDGQGRHSWVEVWFPDLGWVPYDPQNMQFFISNRFVRIEVGVDNNETKNDGLVRWAQSSGARTKPTLQETIGGNFLDDSIRVSAERQNYGPKNLLLGPNVLARLEEAAVQPAPAPPAPEPVPAPPAPVPEPPAPVPPAPAPEAPAPMLPAPEPVPAPSVPAPRPAPPVPAPGSRPLSPPAPGTAPMLPPPGPNFLLLCRPHRNPLPRSARAGARCSGRCCYDKPFVYGNLNFRRASTLRFPEAQAKGGDL